jgi:hypothetical protein
VEAIAALAIRPPAKILLLIGPIFMALDRDHGLGNLFRRPVVGLKIFVHIIFVDILRV